MNKMKQRNIEPAALKLQEAAQYLSVNLSTIRKLVYESKLESFVINARGDRRISVKALDKFMKQNVARNMGVTPLKAVEARRKYKDKPIKNLFDDSKNQKGSEVCKRLLMMK